MDPASGLIVEIDHDLKGKNVKEAILCFLYGHGSTVGSYMLYSLANRGLDPKAIVNQAADPVVVVGAKIGEIHMVDRIGIQKSMTAIQSRLTPQRERLRSSGKTRGVLCYTCAIVTWIKNSE